jgi:hypothetical protein
METNPDLEFEMFLATKLGMTVARMRRELAADEYMRWGVYFARKAQREELARLQRGGGKT